jgi:hypothetical protein
MSIVCRGEINRGQVEERDQMQQVARFRCRQAPPDDIDTDKMIVIVCLLYFHGSELCSMSLLASESVVQSAAE